MNLSEILNIISKNNLNNINKLITKIEDLKKEKFIYLIFTLEKEVRNKQLEDLKEKYNSDYIKDLFFENDSSIFENTLIKELFKVANDKEKIISTELDDVINDKKLLNQLKSLVNNNLSLFLKAFENFLDSDKKVLFINGNLIIYLIPFILNEKNMNKINSFFNSENDYTKMIDFKLRFGFLFEDKYRINFKYLLKHLLSETSRHLIDDDMIAEEELFISSKFDLENIVFQKSLIDNFNFLDLCIFCKYKDFYDLCKDIEVILIGDFHSQFYDFSLIAINEINNYALTRGFLKSEIGRSTFMTISNSLKKHELEDKPIIDPGLISKLTL